MRINKLSVLFVRFPHTIPGFNAWSKRRTLWLEFNLLRTAYLVALSRVSGLPKPAGDLCAWSLKVNFALWKLFFCPAFESNLSDGDRWSRCSNTTDSSNLCRTNLIKFLSSLHCLSLEDKYLKKKISWRLDSKAMQSLHFFGQQKFWLKSS